MDEPLFPPQTPKDLRGLSEEELASFGIRKNLALLLDELHYAIDSGLDPVRLHDIVEMWDFNHGEMSFDALTDWGRPCSCEDCATNVMPYDEEGRLVEGACEWYMVTAEAWQAATGPQGPPQYLCLGCLERRLERPLEPGDFADLPVNEPSILDTARLHALLVARAESSSTGDR